MRIVSLCVSICTLTMILSSCHSQKVVESLKVDSTDITHAFNTALFLDLCDTITICQFDTLGQPHEQIQVVRHRQQKAQATAKDTTEQRQVQKTHQTTTKNKYQVHMESYDAILNWTLLIAFLMFSAILYRKLHL